MGWFSREKTTIEKLSEDFLDAYPAWAIQHSTQLARELKTNGAGHAEGIWKELLTNSEKEGALIDYLTGAHGAFLTLNPEGTVISALVGQETIEKSISSWPKRSLNFFILASTYHKKSIEHGKDDFLKSLEKFYDITIPPVDAHIAITATNKIIDEDDEQFPNPSLAVAGLLPTLNRLQEEQLTWLKTIIGKYLPST